RKQSKKVSPWKGPSRRFSRSSPTSTSRVVVPSIRILGFGRAILPRLPDAFQRLGRAGCPAGGIPPGRNQRPLYKHRKAPTQFVPKRDRAFCHFETEVRCKQR